MTTRIAVLGSTGSIGRQTLAVVDQYPDQFAVVALAAGQNVGLLNEQAARYRPALVSVSRPEDRAAVCAPGAEVLTGDDGLNAVATHPDADIVVIATSGHQAIGPTLAAISRGKTIALANKEVIVCAGELVMDAVRRHGVELRPIDSEHSAIWQCLQGRRGLSEVAKVTLTASGGPFRTLAADALARVTIDQALAHPTWQMGHKVTIDSATLMNKGLEVIEAHWLFDLPYDTIDVVIHPQSVVHSLVTLVDGSVIAQLGVQDMRLPIQYALSFPERLPAPHLALDLTALPNLEFAPPDLERFPALRIAAEAGRMGKTYPAALSAADEVAVQVFLAGTIGFTEITAAVRAVLDRHH